MKSPRNKSSQWLSTFSVVLRCHYYFGLQITRVQKKQNVTDRDRIAEHLKSESGTEKILLEVFHTINWALRFKHAWVFNKRQSTALVNFFKRHWHLFTWKFYVVDSLKCNKNMFECSSWKSEKKSMRENHSEKKTLLVNETFFMALLSYTEQHLNYNSWKLEHFFNWIPWAPVKLEMKIFLAIGAFCTFVMQCEPKGRNFMKLKRFSISKEFKNDVKVLWNM